MVVLTSGLRAYAQDPQFSHYMFNNVYNNPAYSGVEGYTTLTGIYRTQWLGYNPTVGTGGAPVTQLVTLSSPIMRYNAGFGFYAMNDEIGPVNFIHVQASGAYHLGIKDSKLSIGFRAGAITMATNKDEYRAIDPDDDVINRIQPTQVRPDFSLGVHYQTEKLYVGASFNHLIEASFDFGVDTIRNAYPRLVNVTAGYSFPVTYDITITPSFLVKSELKTLSFDISVLGTYKEKIWGGLSYRQQEAAVVMLGYSFFKENTLKFGYAFDYTVVAQDAKSATSHELMISYRLPAISTSGKKVVRTPRFRH